MLQTTHLISLQLHVFVQRLVPLELRKFTALNAGMLLMPQCRTSVQFVFWGMFICSGLECSLCLSSLDKSHLQEFMETRHVLQYHVCEHLVPFPAPTLTLQRGRDSILTAAVFIWQLQPRDPEDSGSISTWLSGIHGPVRGPPHAPSSARQPGWQE